MSRQAITLGRRIGSQKWELVHGPEKPVHDQNMAFRLANNSPANAVWDELKIWEDHGQTRRRVFNVRPSDISTEHKNAQATEKKPKSNK